LELPEISVVSPVYQAEGCLPGLVKEIHDELTRLTARFEILLVEDGSRDGSWSAIERLCRIYPNLRALKLSRNFGQHYAITAGLEAARGECVIVLDCDGQDDPHYFRELIQKRKEGFDVVFTTKAKRAHPFWKNWLARIFRRVFNWLSSSDPSARGEVGSYSLITRPVVDAFLRVNDYHRHYLMVLRWLGFSRAYVAVEHRPRREGVSSYSLQKMFHHAVNGIVSQSDKLLHLSIAVGFGLFALSLALTVYLVATYLLHGYQPGWTSLVVLILGSTGTILVSLGVLGLYIGKIFDQTKGRPLFVVERTLNL
jgi:polyisoprenyl-phosphate glycosyltransferase